MLSLAEKKLNEEIEGLFKAPIDYQRVKTFCLKKCSEFNPAQVGTFLHKLKDHFPQQSELVPVLVGQIFALLNNEKTTWLIANFGYLFSGLIRWEINLADKIEKTSFTYQNLIDALLKKIMSLSIPFDGQADKNISAMTNIFQTLVKWRASLDTVIEPNLKYSHVIVYMLAQLEYSTGHAVSVSSSFNQQVELMDFSETVALLSILARWNFSSDEIISEQFRFANLYGYLITEVMRNLKNARMQGQPIIPEIQIVYLLNAIAQLDDFIIRTDFLEELGDWLERNEAKLSATAAISCLWGLLVGYHIKLLGEDPAGPPVPPLIQKLINNINKAGENRAIPCEPIYVKQLKEISIFISAIKMEGFFSEKDLEAAYKKIELHESKRSKFEDNQLLQLSRLLPGYSMKKSLFHKPSCHVIDAVYGEKAAVEVDGPWHYYRRVGGICNQPTAATKWRKKLLEKTGYQDKLVIISSFDTVDQAAEKIKKILVDTKNSVAVTTQPEFKNRKTKSSGHGVKTDNPYAVLNQENDDVVHRSSTGGKEEITVKKNPVMKKNKKLSRGEREKSEDAFLNKAIAKNQEYLKQKAEAEKNICSKLVGMLGQMFWSKEEPQTEQQKPDLSQATKRKYE